MIVHIRMRTARQSRLARACQPLISTSPAHGGVYHFPDELPQAKRRKPLRIAREVVREPIFTLLIAAGVV
jgi:hypothetical protein